MTGLVTLQEKVDLPSINGLIWRLIPFTIWTFWLRTLQEFIDLMAFKGLLIGNTRVTDITFTYNSWTNRLTDS